MKKILLDLLKYQTGFMVFYGILIAAKIMEKDVFSSPTYWGVLLIGNAAFILVMTVLHLYRHKKPKK